MDVHPDFRDLLSALSDENADFIVVGQRPDIDAALAMLGAAAERSELLRRALCRAEGK